MDEAASVMIDGSEATKPVMAHVLFVDIVRYSALRTDQQIRTVNLLQQIVKTSPAFQRAQAANQLIRNPTGDGVALVFFEDVFAPVRCAREVAQGARRENIDLRIGLHSGFVYRLSDINGKENVAGGGINLAQRVMDCGDAGHILVSGTHACFLAEFGDWKEDLHDLGIAEVKHGVKLQLFSYYDAEVGNAAAPAKLLARKEEATSPPVAKQPFRIAIIYKRGAQPDEQLVAILERFFQDQNCPVFIDRHLQVGLDWAKEIEKVIKSADAVIALLSPSAVASEMLALELQIADETAQQNQGRPRILPVRVQWEGPLPPQLASILQRFQYALWRGAEDNAVVTAELLDALQNPVPVAVSRRNLEAPGGAVPLNSQFYILRPSDQELAAAIENRDSVVLVEGARQMGKTSLLSRGLQQARQAGSKAVFTDFQKLNAADLGSLEKFYQTLGGALADQLSLDCFPEEVWRAQRGPNENFERFVRREVLEKVDKPLVWGLDEVDRLFTSPFGGEVFGLFRSWHNARALDPGSPWMRLTQVISYATEAHLFITDINQSPFNIGTKIAMRDFTPADVAALNRRAGQPLKSEAEEQQLHRLLGGQPYLVRRTLHELTARGKSLAEIVQTAAGNEGPFGDHLRRFLVLLMRDAGLLDALRELLAGRRLSDGRIFQRLRAAGLLRGETPADACFRCEVYEAYFRKHLG